MKKNLLALFALGAICNSIYAQTNTFINDAVIVKVNPNTLFYNGGSVTVNTATATGTTEKIINQGNFQVRGGFTNQNTTGKNFVNKYTGASSYGQLIIDNASTVTGNIAIEKTKMDVNANEYAIVGLPFQGSTVSSIINNTTGTTSFEGNCAVKTSCGQGRYNQSALVWDVANTEYDAVTNTSTVVPGANYTLNVKNGGVRTFIQSLGAATLFGMYGVPNNKTVTFNYESGLFNYPTKAAYSAVTWGTWKNLTNHYNERYSSYLGNPTGQDSSTRFGKNIHRFSNPFTSNLDLSDVSQASSWIKIIVSGTERTPTQLHDTALRIRITKLPIAYTINWGQNSGASNTNNTSSTRISAYLTKASTGTTPYTWTGNPDALIIKPFEYFEVEYPTLVAANIGGTNIVTSRYVFADAQKTFDYNFTGRPANSGQFARSAQNVENKSYLNNETLKQKGLVSDSDFTQIEFFLSKNDEIQGEAGYLINSSNYTSGSANPATVRISENPIFIYEETKDGTVLDNNQTLLNEFNSQDYVGKPIRLGFNNLQNGEQYRINLRLFEQSILNQIDNFSVGTYYLLDKVTNKVTTVDGSTEIAFTADDKTNNRYELYWNQEPKSLGTDDLNKNKATYLYANNNQKYVHFEEKSTTASVEVYDVTGRLISRFSDVNTNSDYKLDIVNSPNLYVVVITYKNGKVVSEKTTSK